MDKKNIFLKRFITGSVLIIIGQIISQLIGFISFIIIARGISIGDFGIFVLVLVVINFFIMLSNFGLESTVIKFIASDTENKKNIIATSLGFRLIVSIFVFLVILLIKNLFVLFFHSEKLKSFILIIALFFIFEYLLQLFQSFLQALHLYKRLIIIQISSSIIRLFLISFLLLYLQGDLSGVLIVYLGISIFTNIMGYLFLPWVVLPNIKFNTIKKLLAFGFPLQIDQCLSFVFERTGLVMLASMVGSVGVAGYELGGKVPESLRNMLISFRRVYFPHMCELYAKNDNEFAEKFLIHLLRLTTFFTAFMALLAGLFNQEIIQFLFSSKYLASGSVLTLIMIRMAVGLCNYLMATTLIASGRQKLILISSSAEALSSVIANYLLISNWGMIGAAWGILTSTIIANPILLMLLKQNRLLVSRSYLRSLIPLVICIGVFYLIPVENLYLRINFVVLFILFSIYSKTITPHEIKSFLNVIKPSYPVKL